MWFLMSEVPLNTANHKNRNRPPYSLALFQEVHSEPYTLHPTPYTLHPTPYALRPIPYALHPTTCTLHPTPYTLHSTPCTLHPTPYTLHPTPHTLHPTPYTRTTSSSTIYYRPKSQKPFPPLLRIQTLPPPPPYPSISQPYHGVFGPTNLVSPGILSIQFWRICTADLARELAHSRRTRVIIQLISEDCTTKLKVTGVHAIATMWNMHHKTISK